MTADNDAKKLQKLYTLQESSSIFAKAEPDFQSTQLPLAPRNQLDRFSASHEIRTHGFSLMY